MAYIKLPTALWYGTLNILSISAGDDGDISLDSFPSKGVATGLQSLISKRLRIPSTYFAWVSWIVPFCRSRDTWKPKQYFNSPRSFMSNLSFNSDFRLVIIL